MDEATHIPARLPGLSRKDRARLDALLSQPMRFVDHPMFHASNALEQVFNGPDPVSIKSPVFSDEFVPLLTREQERAMFLRYNFCRMIAAALHERFTREPDADTGRELLAWWDRAARYGQRIAEHNLGLAYHFALRFGTPYMEADDCISLAFIGLMKGVAGYDLSSGARFSTYAGSAIHRRLVQENMKAKRRRKGEVLETDATGNNTDRPSMIVSAPAADDEAVEARRMLGELLAAHAGLLTGRERLVLGRRFGLDLRGSKARVTTTRHAMTLQAVGDSLGLSKERARQIQQSALDKLRHPQPSTPCPKTQGLNHEQTQKHQGTHLPTLHRLPG